MKKYILFSFVFLMYSMGVLGQKDRCFKKISDDIWDLEICLDVDWSVDFQSKDVVKILIRNNNAYIYSETIDTRLTKDQLYNDCFGYIDTLYQDLVVRFEDDRSDFRIYRNNETNLYILRGLLYKGSYAYKFFNDNTDLENLKRISKDLMQRIFILGNKKKVNRDDQALIDFEETFIESLKYPELIENVWLEAKVLNGDMPIDVKKILVKRKQERIKQKLSEIISMTRENYQLYKIDFIEKDVFSKEEVLVSGLLIFKSKESIERVYVDFEVVKIQNNFYLHAFGDINIATPAGVYKNYLKASHSEGK